MEGKSKNEGRRKAVVMGATSGIGREVALELVRKGWMVGVAGRRMERLEQLKQTVEGIVAIACIDVDRPEATARLESLIDEMGGIDLYFHSSGIGWQNPMLEPDKELLTVSTNALGFVRMVDCAFHRFVKQGRGHIACISSIAGTKGLGAAPAYSATKRFQNHYLECLEQLARMRGVRLQITDIRPGFVATDLIAGSSYPLQLSAADVARQIVRGVERKRSVLVVDWRYRWLVFFWKLIPRWLWVRMRIGTKP
ncbi:MAG: SDR family NAD(P)-dependent oxidoreductase [Bacteroidaceae bacterium]